MKNYYNKKEMYNVSNLTEYYMLKEDIAPFLFKRICHTNIFKQAEIKWMQYK